MWDADSIHSIFISIRASLERAILGIVPPKEIEDIVQEAYVRVCQLEDKGKIRKPRSFLYKTATNLALDYAKRAENRLTVSLENTEFDVELSNSVGLNDETLNDVVTNEEFSIFCDAVRRLPVKCRRVFVLKKVYGYSQKEIAAEMNLSEGTVEKHISEGIKRCTYYMMKNGSGDYESKQTKRVTTLKR